MWGLARRKQDWRVSGLVHCAKHLKLLDCRACIGFYTPRYEGKIGTRNSPKTPYIAPFKNTRKANKGRDTENRFRERVGLSTPSLYVYGPKEWCPDPLSWSPVQWHSPMAWNLTRCHFSPNFLSILREKSVHVSFLRAKETCERRQSCPQSPRVFGPRCPRVSGNEIAAHDGTKEKNVLPVGCIFLNKITDPFHQNIKMFCLYLEAKFVHYLDVNFSLS